MTFGIDWIRRLVGKQVEDALIVDFDKRDEYLSGRFIGVGGSVEQTRQDPRNYSARIAKGNLIVNEILSKPQSFLHLRRDSPLNGVP